MLEKEYYLLDCLSRLIARHAGEAGPRRDGRAQPAVRRALTFLEDCWEEKTSLTHLAQIAGLSPFHFAREFTRDIGIPPHVFQTQLRLKKATDLLARGCSPVDVATRTGFFDQSHFHRSFQKKFGLTPGQYRAASRGAR